MNESIANKKAGDRLLFSEMPGCFLCGWKSADPERLGMNLVRLHDTRGPVFFVCATCACEDDAVERVAEKVFKLQAEQLGERP